MNYEDMTDYEINKAVATSWLECDYDFDDEGEVVDLIGYQTYLGAHGVPDERLEKYGEFNPLKNVSDAWPIIIKNSIVIELRENKSSLAYLKGDAPCEDKNPLRAAMIVYLMMREQK